MVHGVLLTYLLTSFIAMFIGIQSTHILSIHFFLASLGWCMCISSRVCTVSRCVWCCRARWRSTAGLHSWSNDGWSVGLRRRMGMGTWQLGILQLGFGKLGVVWRRQLGQLWRLWLACALQNDIHVRFWSDQKSLDTCVYVLYFSIYFMRLVNISSVVC